MPELNLTTVVTSIIVVLLLALPFVAARLPHSRRTVSGDLESYGPATRDLERSGPGPGFTYALVPPGGRPEEEDGGEKGSWQWCLAFIPEETSEGGSELPPWWARRCSRPAGRRRVHPPTGSAMSRINWKCVRRARPPTNWQRPARMACILLPVPVSEADRSALRSPAGPVAGRGFRGRSLRGEGIGRAGAPIGRPRLPVSRSGPPRPPVRRMTGCPVRPSRPRCTSTTPHPRR